MTHEGLQALAGITDQLGEDSEIDTIETVHAVFLHPLSLPRRIWAYLAVGKPEFAEKRRAAGHSLVVGGNQFCKERTMRVGVPKEIKVEEYRVGLTPASVREYVAHGHEVVVQRGAGDGIGAGDDAYTQAGARIADTAEGVFSVAEMIVKVKEPQPSEWISY